MFLPILRTNFSASETYYVIVNIIHNYFFLTIYGIHLFIHVLNTNQYAFGSGAAMLCEWSTLTWVGVRVARWLDSEDADKLRRLLELPERLEPVLAVLQEWAPAIRDLRTYVQVSAPQRRSHNLTIPNINIIYLNFQVSHAIFCCYKIIFKRYFRKYIACRRDFHTTFEMYYYRVIVNLPRLEHGHFEDHVVPRIIYLSRQKSKVSINFKYIVLKKHLVGSRILQVLNKI